VRKGEIGKCHVEEEKEEVGSLRADQENGLVEEEAEEGKCAG
jgi:hypothetical protein